MLKCPKKNKNCKCSLIYQCDGGDFICGGVNSKPSKYNGDIVQLCLKGQLSVRTIEMTIAEAAMISSVLTGVIGDLSPKILRKTNASYKKKEKTKK